MDRQDYNFRQLKESVDESIKELINATYYDNFFSFTNVGKKEFYDFVIGDTNLNEINMEIDYQNPKLIKTLLDFRLKKRFPIDLLNRIFIGEFKNISREYLIDISTDEDLFYRTLLKYVLYRALDEEFNSSIIMYPKDEIEFAQYMNSKNDKFLFRGQSDYSWQITPSLVRNLNVNDDLYINQITLYELYNEYGYSDSLLARYNKSFKDKRINRPSMIDYDFLSRMQHAVSYSPLVDFTSDYNVALTFALKASNPNNFMYNDSAIYFLDVNHPTLENKITNIADANKIIASTSISLLNSKIKIGTIKTIKDAHGNPHTLSFKNYDEIVESILPKFLIIDIPTNDRMLIQKGKFVIFYDYVLVKGKMFSPFDNFKNICVKHRISAKDKPRLLNWLHKHYPEVKESYLMDPYLIFRD